LNLLRSIDETDEQPECSFLLIYLPRIIVYHEQTQML
jgi:hypothetical protein